MHKTTMMFVFTLALASVAVEATQAAQAAMKDDKFDEHVAAKRKEISEKLATQEARNLALNHQDATMKEAKSHKQEEAECADKTDTQADEAATPEIPGVKATGDAAVKELGLASYPEWLDGIAKELDADPSLHGGCNATVAFETHKAIFGQPKTPEQKADDIANTYAKDTHVMFYTTSNENAGTAQYGAGFDIMGRENISAFYLKYVMPTYSCATTKIVFSDVSEEDKIIHAVTNAPDCGTDVLSETYVLNDECLVQTHTLVQTNLPKSAGRRLALGFVTGLVSIMGLGWF